MLTDCVFWFIIFPFLTIKDYNLNFVSISAVFSNMASHILTEKESTNTSLVSLLAVVDRNAFSECCFLAW
jgi:hypothetical protein